jgi:hypothetical protein
MSAVSQGVMNRVSRDRGIASGRNGGGQVRSSSSCGPAQLPATSASFFPLLPQLNTSWAYERSSLAGCPKENRGNQESRRKVRIRLSTPPVRTQGSQPLTYHDASPQDTRNPLQSSQMYYLVISRINIFILIFSTCPDRPWMADPYLGGGPFLVPTATSPSCPGISSSEIPPVLAVLSLPAHPLHHLTIILAISPFHTNNLIPFLLTDLDSYYLQQFSNPASVVRALTVPPTQPLSSPAQRLPSASGLPCHRDSCTVAILLQ